MTVQVQQAAFAKAVGVVSRIATARGTQPILGSIALDTHEGRLRLRATDLELSAVVACDAMVGGEGGIAVPAKLLADWVNSLPVVPIALELRGDRLFAHGGGRKGEFGGYPIDDFPSIPNLANEPWTVLDEKELAVAIDRTAFAADLGKGGIPLLRGVVLRPVPGAFEVAAGDGFRLAAQRLPGLEIAREVVVPSRAMDEVAKLSGADMLQFATNPTGTVAAFRLGDVEIVSQTYQGKYPNYAAYLQRATEGVNAKVQVSRDELLSAMRTAAVAAQEDGQLRFEVRPEGLRVSCHEHSTAKSEAVIPCTLSADTIPGQTIRAAFNLKWLPAAASAFPAGSELVWHWTSTEAIQLFTSEAAPGYNHLLMPLVSMVWN